jgi:hypothetical protein
MLVLLGSDGAHLYENSNSVLYVVKHRLKDGLLTVTTKPARLSGHRGLSLRLTKRLPFK